MDDARDAKMAVFDRLVHAKQDFSDSLDPAGANKQ